MIRMLFAALATLLLAAGSTFADDKADKKKSKGPDLDAVFTKLDADKDGKLSPTEFATASTELKKKKEGDAAKGTAKSGKLADMLFAKLDADKDGKLSKDEFKKVVETMKAAKQEKKKDK